MFRTASVAKLSPVFGVALVANLLTGCAAGGGMSGISSFTQAGRIGPDNGSDSCYAQAQALDNTGNFFGQDILAGAGAGALAGGLIGGLASGNWKGALVGAGVGGAVGAAGGYWAALQQQSQDTATLEATVTNNLTTENTQIDATQIAFNNDMDCRFQQAQTIRTQYAAGQLTLAAAQAQMTQVQSWAQRDLALAQKINGQIQSRGAQFDTAVTNLNNGAPAPGSTDQAANDISKPAAIRTAAPLLLRADPSAPVIGQLASQQPVTVTGASNGYALVDTSNGTQGFTPLEDVGTPGGTRTIEIPQQQTASLSGGTPVEQLDGSNAARRDSFAQSVAVSQSAVSNGFQLSG